MMDEEITVIREEARLVRKYDCVRISISTPMLFVSLLVRSYLLLVKDHYFLLRHKDESRNMEGFLR